VTQNNNSLASIVTLIYWPLACTVLDPDTR
jgi:hypothetical protein